MYSAVRDFIWKKLVFLAERLRQSAAAARLVSVTPSGNRHLIPNRQTFDETSIDTDKRYTKPLASARNIFYRKLSSSIRKTRQQSRKALTLPEVVIAAALLLSALVPILKGLTQAHLNSAIIERKTQSLGLAQAKLNKIQAISIYDFDSIASQDGEVLNVSYLCKTTVSSVNSNLTAVTVSVGKDINSNGSLDSGEIEITLQTQIAKRWQE